MLFALMATGFTIGILYFLLVAPYLLAKGMFTLEYGECAGSDKFKCMLPFYNLFIAEKLYNGKFPIIAVSSFLTFVFMIVRIIIMFVAPAQITLTVVILGLFILSMLVFWVSSSYMVYKLLDQTDAVYGFKKTASIILFPIGEFYIGNYLALSIRNDMKASEAI